MTDNKQIGLYWSDNRILCVDVISAESTRILSIPIKINGTLPKDETAAPDLKLVSQELQNFLKNNRISADEYNLALPTKDIIFRSFVIPWMPSHEIKGAVEFEAGKYIPFGLDELKYAYHVVHIQEATLKRLKIIFVAIRKDSFETYKQILESASINIKSIEPAQISLIRTLTAKNVLPSEGVTAVVEQNVDSGKITIVQNKIPLFVREFQIRSPSVNMDQMLAETNKTTKFINEIKISLDYFARQDNALSANQILLITNNLSEGLPEQISADLSLKVTAYSSKNLIANHDAGDINYLCAYGAAIFDNINLGVDINFSNQKLKKTKTKSKNEPRKALNIKLLVTVALACAAILLAVFFVTTKKLNQSQAEIDRFKQELGEFADMKAEKIDLKNAEMLKKQNNYELIRIKSTISNFLTQIPELLPTGTWLEDFQISYKESGFENKPVLMLNGLAYHENPNEQFRLVYQFQKNLKETKKLTEIFTNIDILTTEARRQDDFDVTYFKIICK